MQFFVYKLIGAVNLYYFPPIMFIPDSPDPKLDAVVRCWMLHASRSRRSIHAYRLP